MYVAHHQFVAKTYQTPQETLSGWAAAGKSVAWAGMMWLFGACPLEHKMNYGIQKTPLYQIVKSFLCHNASDFMLHSFPQGTASRVMTRFERWGWELFIPMAIFGLIF